MSNLYLDLHIVQTLPPSNVNRDESGSPKMARFGGVPRARVSSQAWKRAVRKQFSEILEPEKQGIRSKRLVSAISDKIAETDPEKSPQSEELAIKLLGLLGIKTESPRRNKTSASDDEVNESAESSYLIFLSNQQIQSLAEYAIETVESGKTPVKKEVIARANTAHSFDIALFGRMVADITDLKVDAAAQVAHAISVHPVENEFDYFTAIDDNSKGDHAGAGMIGTVEFNSSTLYRYATINIAALHEHLGQSEATESAIRAFITAFALSLPSGKQNSFAHNSPPHAVIATLRTDRPVNLVSAFETPIERSGDESRLTRTAAALIEHKESLDGAYASGEQHNWITLASKEMHALSSLATPISLSELADQVSSKTSQFIQS